MIGLFHNHFGCLLAAVSQGLYHDVDAFLKTALLCAAYCEDGCLYGCTVFCGSVDVLDACSYRCSHALRAGKTA